ncbi:ricin B lectin domain-containing protein [Syncephalastrum racemosum]|uniref:Ricin B lectin domain-containing protein n=1 Tax=Syncephalastrum racemosum TaxID=13706 RepID=A0A1X2HSZ5_SYNRA|nr:ricin B lectin domain-containing protein [Syncephalastrum racemosum]
MFPQGYFYIISRKNGYALDVYDGQTKADANIIVWPQKFQDSDNQLWTYDQGRIVNKKSGHVLDVRSSAFKKDKAVIQNKRKDKNQTQEWTFDNGFICSQVYQTMVLDIKGDSDEGGAQVLLYKRKETDNLNQQWFLEPYHTFESSLNMAADAGPLHKKADFGQPRLGYGAEVGVPPELKKLPADIKVVGVTGATATPSAPSNQQSTDSLGTPEGLNAGNYPGGYQQGSGTQTGPAGQPGYAPYSPQQQQQPSPSGAYHAPPPPLPQSQYPPQYQQPQHVYGGQASNYPPPGGAYPATSQSPPPSSNPGPGGFYPPPSSPPQHGGGYPPQNMPLPGQGYPQPGSGYPPQQNPGYPPYSPQ